MTLLRDALAESIRQRSKLVRLVVSEEDFQSWVGGKIDEFDCVYVGHCSVTVMTIKTKLILPPYYPAPPGDLAREYLRLVYDAGSPHGCRPSAPGFSWGAPLYADPTRSGHLAYVDVEHAYWQLLTPWRPDDRVRPDGTVLDGDLDWITVDEVEEDRELRHAIVGMVFSNHITIHRRGVPRQVRLTARWSNPSLRRLVMSTLHALAGEARERFGLHAWLTDAAIVDATKADDLIDWLAITWGIRARVVAYGPGEVWSTTTYAVGDKLTMNLVHGEVTPVTAARRPWSNLQVVNGEALRRARLERLGGECCSTDIERRRRGSLPPRDMNHDEAT